jgi:hypothetical protein
MLQEYFNDKYLLVKSLQSFLTENIFKKFVLSHGKKKSLIMTKLSSFSPDLAIALGADAVIRILLREKQRKILLIISSFFSYFPYRRRWRNRKVDFLGER